MKKILSIFVLQIFVFGCIFGATINSKEGYGDLSWGSTVADAQKAGYKLTIMSSNAEKEYLSKLYTETVVGYHVETKDNNVSSLQFHFYQGRLFVVTEMLKMKEFNQKILETRYGKFKEQGIFQFGKQYFDAKFSSNGKVSFLSIVISNPTGNISTVMNDWNIYKNISVLGRSLIGIHKERTITSDFVQIANKLIQVKSDKSKPSIAFLALTTDYRNSLVENYIIDALTEAVFNTGHMKIIERSNLEMILNEQKFQSSGLVDEATAKSIGMLVGADFVCYGTLKDLDTEFKVNIRIVDVETGELCSIASGNVIKDAYLKKQVKSAIGETTSTVSETKTTTQKIQPSETPQPKVANNAWKVVKYRDDFGGFTQYVFMVNSADTRMLVVIYQKYENLANSRVIAGVHWGNGYSWDIEGTYDIKGNDNTVSKKLNDIWTCNLNASGKDKFTFVWNQKLASRWLVNIIKNSDSVSLRRDGLIRRFQTAGLMDKMAEYGITWAEIDAALANEEF